MILAAYMKEHGLTDQEMASRLGLSQPYVCRLRKLERRPSVKVAKDLEGITNIPAANFIFDEGRAES
jgi:transcriptional regulator with XRE-family HTH domain